MTFKDFVFQFYNCQQFCTEGVTVKPLLGTSLKNQTLSHLPGDTKELLQGPLMALVFLDHTVKVVCCRIRACIKVEFVQDRGEKAPQLGFVTITCTISLHRHKNRAYPFQMEKEFSVPHKCEADWKFTSQQTQQAHANLSHSSNFPPA